MNEEEKISELKRTINNILIPEISNDYVYLDLPYYTNIGDTLIWEGTKEFLKQIPHKCLYASDMYFFVQRPLARDVVILLQGGGNFGDTYREHSRFRKRIIALYPNNKVIILPQSVHYENEDNMIEDVSFYSKYPNVVICARDRYTFEYLTKKFPNRILLLPDLAFYVNVNRFSISSSSHKVLFFKRTDQEFLPFVDYHQIPINADCKDWPTYDYVPFRLSVIDKCFRPLKLIGFIFGGIKWKNKFEDIKRDRYYRKAYVQCGINLLSKYDTIYTTRLHALILGVLLGKRIYIYDNATGKICNYFKTWLYDIETISICYDSQRM